MASARVGLRTFVGAGFLLVGVLQLLWALMTAWTAERALHWPTVQGVILASSVRVEPSRGGYAYIPQVSYEYRLGTNRYEGQAITAMDAADFEETVRNMVAAYPGGLTVRVYVDPKDPHHALLKPGFSTYLAFWLGLSLVGIVVGVGLIAPSFWKATD